MAPLADPAPATHADNSSAAVQADTAPLLEIRHLSTSFFTRAGEAPAVRDVSLTLPRSGTLAVVGESGCGKTMLALSVMRLVPSPGRIVAGEVLFQGEDLTRVSERRMQAIRGNFISMIFQEPMTSLNPVFRIGEQIAEAIRLHQDKGKSEALDMAEGLLDQVGIPDPRARLASYPHELSGGMRQRVMIAMALACDPDVILADEPTTALDVTIQAEILQLIADLQERRRTAVLLITHDLGVVAETCREVAIMYAGEIVERSTVADLFAEPLHPYTRLLLAAVPRIGRTARELSSIKGAVPNLLELPSGCHFHPRCPEAFDRCPREHPPLLSHPGSDGERGVRCWLYD